MEKLIRGVDAATANESESDNGRYVNCAGTFEDSMRLKHQVGERQCTTERALSGQKIIGDPVDLGLDPHLQNFPNPNRRLLDMDEAELDEFFLGVARWVCHDGRVSG